MINALTFSERGKFKHTDLYSAPKDQYIASARLVFSQQQKVTSRISPARFNLNKSRIETESDQTSLLKGVRSNSISQDDPYPGSVRIHIEGLSNGICCCGASRAEGSLEVKLRNRPALNPSGNNVLAESSRGGIDFQKDLHQSAKGDAIVAVGDVTIVHSSPLSVQSAPARSSKDLSLQTATKITGNLSSLQSIEAGRDAIIAGESVHIVNQVLSEELIHALKVIAGQPISEVFAVFAKRILQDANRQSEHSLYIAGDCVPSKEQLFDHRAAKPVQTVFEDFMKSEKKVLLLQASAGTGKTMFTQRVEQDLFRHFSDKPEDIIPIRIELAGLVDPVHRAIEEGLENKGLNHTQIQMLKERKTLIILDGVDEALYEGKKLSTTHHLYLTNKLHLWPNAKVIFGVRDDGGSEVVLKSEQFMPYSNESNTSGQRQLLQQVVLCPFSPQKRKSYVAQYVRNAPADWKAKYPEWAENNGQKYLEMFELEQVRGARDLTTKPFTLRVLLEVLPNIVAQSTEENNGVFDAKTLEITEDKVYQEFMNSWFNREETKLVGQAIPEKVNELGAVNCAWNYCKQLANAMKERNVTKVRYVPAIQFGNLSGFPNDENMEFWKSYFGDDPVAKLCLRMSPMRRLGNGERAFIHKYIQDFFATRYVRDFNMSVQDDSM